jgi:FHA domain
MITRTASAQQKGHCCRASALEDAEATFCIECGEPLLRCMAFEECGGIVDETGLCPVCVRPQLQIVPGATMKAAVGGSVAVPFELVNGSGVDRPLFVKRLWSREKGEWREERLGWEKLASGERAPASVTAKEIDAHGLHEIEIMWEVATQWLTREEHFAFSTRVLLEIPERVSEGSTTIQISSENQMNGNIIQLQERDRGATGGQRIVEKLDMNVHRLDRLEREMGMRGLASGEVMLRSARFRYTGFGDGNVLANDKPIVTADAMLHFGRGDLRGTGGRTDARLLLQAADGTLDKDSTLRLSREHFDIYVENARPILRVASQNGVRVNGNAYGQDKLVTLADGDVIAPLVKAPDAISLTVRFRRELNRVSAVELHRTPAWRDANDLEGAKR